MSGLPKSEVLRQTENALYAGGKESDHVLFILSALASEGKLEKEFRDLLDEYVETVRGRAV